MITAQKVLDHYWDGLLPVKPEVFASKMGISVSQSENLPYSGEAGIDQDGVRYIRVKSFEFLPRKRFTLAHEFGHHVLLHVNEHGDRLLRDTDGNFNSNVNDSREREANQFAAELLMPKDTLHFAIGQKGYTTIDSLANLFGVSQAAMKWRLVNLGMING